MIKKVINTDIIIIGGGGAGITAAIAAARNGAQKVTLVSKGQVGNSGNTIMIGGSFAMDGYSAYHEFGYNQANPNFTKETLFNSIIKDGFYLSDQNIVEQFVEDSPKILNEVVKWGEKSGQRFIFMPPATWIVSGRGLGKALTYGLKETGGIDTIQDVLIIELLKNEDCISGAVGINIITGEFIQFNAKSVILGTGGIQPFSLKNTNSDMTGDGVAMAFRAGAKVSDLEFFLFLATALEPHNSRGSIFSVMLLVLGSLENLKIKAVDKNGNLIQISKEFEKLEGSSELFKLIQLYYYGKFIHEGHGTENNGIFLDFSENSNEFIEKVFNKISEIFALLYKKGFYHGDKISEFKNIILKTKKLEIGLGNEYSVGGIFINENMETSIPGLFAGGECASGTFGANRVADAVTEMMVQGYKAGSSAAKYIKTFSQSINNDEQTNNIISSVYSILENNGIDVIEANKKLEEISDKGLSYIRTEELLKNAITQYEKLEKELENISVKSKSKVYNFELIQALQTKNRLLCCKIASEMARQRKESRGLHLRADYPQIDNDNYLHRTIAENINGEIKYSTRKPIVTKFKIELEGKSNYIDFILNNDMGLKNLG